MRATFYYNKSDKNVVDKSISVKDSNVTIYYKEDTDLVHPEFIYENDKFYTDINYLKVEDTYINRYYYIKDVVMSHGYIILKCEEDVLMTYKGKILTLKGILTRNANSYSLYLPDDKLRTYAMTNTSYLPFKRSFAKDQSSYILTLNGGGNSNV